MKKNNIHYLGQRVKGTARRRPACGAHSKRLLVMTEDRRTVTCDRCVRTTFWHEGGALKAA